MRLLAEAYRSNRFVGDVRVAHGVRDRQRDDRPRRRRERAGGPGGAGLGFREAADATGLRAQLLERLDGGAWAHLFTPAEKAAVAQLGGTWRR